MRVEMRTFLVLVAAVLGYSSMVNSESFVCLTDASTGVIKGESGRFESIALNPTHTRLLLSNKSGSWQLFHLGDETPWLNRCPSPFFCENQGSFQGTFIRRKDRTFMAYLLTRKNNEMVPFVVGGRCEQAE